VGEFDSNPVTTVIVVYSPTKVALVTGLLCVPSVKSTVISDIPAHNFLVEQLEPEDFNA
jgi:hypothetical protein